MSRLDRERGVRRGAPQLVCTGRCASPEHQLDVPLANRRFYKQANGYSGAGDLGYAVADDQRASLWTEFQRLGGVEAVGYPITQRFEYDGFLTQGFQKLVSSMAP